MAYFEDAVKDVVGAYTDNATYSATTETFTDDTLNTVFAQGINAVSSALSDNMLLKHAVAPTDLHSSSTVTTTNLRILRVTRRIAADHEVPCKEISASEGAMTGDGNSFAALRTVTTHYLHPVYWIEPLTKRIEISPPLTGVADAIHSGELYTVAEYHSTNCDLSAWVVADMSFLPTKAHLAVIYKTALGIINLRIADAVEEDEDSEILSMLGQQSQALEAAFQGEIQALTSAEMKKESQGA